MKLIKVTITLFLAFIAFTSSAFGFTPLEVNGATTLELPTTNGDTDDGSPK
jgi:hypothetical protein